MGLHLHVLESSKDEHGHVGGVAFDSRKNLELNVGMACNNACVFCVSGMPEGNESRRWLPLEKAKREIKVAFDDGCRSLGFLGGEPTIWPELVASTMYARELGFTRIAVCSNGMKYEDANFVRRLVDAGVTRFAVSVHSHLPELEYALTKVPNALDRKIAGLRNLLAEKAAGRLPDNVSINPVLNKMTYRYVVEFLEFYKALGIDDVRFNFIRPEGKAEVEHDVAEEIIPTFTEVAPFLRRAVIANERRLRIHVTFGEMPICGLPRSLRMTPDLLQRYVGEFQDLVTNVALFAAPKREEGRDGLDRFSWQDRKRSFLKQEVAACNDCRFRGVCFGVGRGYVKMYGDSEFQTQ
ncbi:MAG TPA: radical SAM protein [Polyangiaceae bacterium]|nr:radical SAM protein [Polyangiaceae bacterium]